MPIDWSILRTDGPVDIAGNFARGYQMSTAIIDKLHERNALAAVAANPDDQQAMARLYAANPTTAGFMEQRAIARRKAAADAAEQQRRAELGQLYTTDPAAARTQAMGAGDFDLASEFDKMDETQRQHSAAFFKLAGPLAFKMRQMNDPNQRKAFLEQARPMLVANGVSPQAIDQFDVTNDQALDALIASNQTVDQMVDQGKIVWHEVPEGGGLFATDEMGRPIGKGNPYAGGSQAPSAATAPQSGTRGLRNNNPLNLTKSAFTESLPGYAGTDNGGRYAKFETPEAGMAAGQRLLGSYLARGYDTPAEIVSRWAPAKENGAATTNYINFVAQRLGVNPSEPLHAAQIPALMQAMSDFENGATRVGHGTVTAAAGIPPHVGSKGEFDALPSGTVFIAPDGSQRVKP